MLSGVSRKYMAISILEKITIVGTLWCLFPFSNDSACHVFLAKIQNRQKHLRKNAYIDNWPSMYFATMLKTCCSVLITKNIEIPTVF